MDQVNPALQKQLTSLTTEQREQALIKYRVIAPYLENQKTLNTVCKENSIPLRTARTWVSLYRKSGLIALARHPRNDKGKNRKITIELRQLIEGLYLKSSHLSCASIYRQIKKHQQEKKLPYPRYRTVCEILSYLPKSMKILAHKGNKVYKETFDLLYIREAQKSNEIWQADHVNLDIMLINQKGKPQRPWLTIIFDDYSRCIAGYELSFMAPSAMKTSLCLRTAIWRKKEPLWTICGIPSTLYTDHGSDFTSIHIEQVCIDLKINLIFSQIGQPRGRGKIERFFLTLNQKFLCELEGYTKSKSIIPKLRLFDLDTLLHQFIIEYNQSEHSQTGFTPKQRWEENGFLPNFPESVEELDLLLLTIIKPRKIMRDGIHFQGLRYIDPVLADYIGESIIIRYDPADLTSIRVFYKNQFLCQPICGALSHHQVSLKEIQAARNAKRKALYTEIDQRLSLVDAILNNKSTIIHSIPPDIPPSNNTVKKIKLKCYENEN